MKKEIALILLQFIFINAHAMMSENDKGGLPNTKSDKSNGTDQIYEDHEHGTSASPKEVYFKEIFPPPKPELSEVTQENITARIIEVCRAISRNCKDTMKQKNAAWKIRLDLGDNNGENIKIETLITPENGILFSNTEFNPTSESNNPLPAALIELAIEFYSAYVSEKSPHRDCKPVSRYTELLIKTPMRDLSPMNTQNIMLRIIRNCVIIKEVIGKSMPIDPEKDCNLQLQLRLNPNTRYKIDIPYNLVEMFTEMKIDHDTNTDSPEFDILRSYADDVFMAYETAERSSF